MLGQSLCFFGGDAKNDGLSMLKNSGIVVKHPPETMVDAGNHVFGTFWDHSRGI